MNDTVSRKPNAEVGVICEQIIRDASGLTFQFEMKPTIVDGKEAQEFVLRVFGEALPFGNRELFFDLDGEFVAAGTSTRGLCKPTWLTNPDDL